MKGQLEGILSYCSQQKGNIERTSYGLSKVQQYADVTWKKNYYGRV